MNLSRLLPAIEQGLDLASVRARLASNGTLTVGVSDAAKAAFVSALLQNATVPSLFIVPKLTIAQDAVDELKAWLGDSLPVLLFPERDALPYEFSSPDPALISERLRALQALDRGEPCVVISSAIAAAQRTLPRGRAHSLKLEAGGGNTSLTEVIDSLLVIGYRHVPIVERPGDVARRGGIVDVYPPTESSPVRIEFFGDQVETIRRFSLETQRSDKSISALMLGPAREAIDLVSNVATLRDHLVLEDLEPATRERFEEHLARIEQGDSFPEEHFFVPFVANGTVLEHLPDNGLLVIDEPSQVAETAQEHDEQTVEDRHELETRGELPKGMPLPHQDWSSLRQALDARQPQLRLSRWALGGEDAVETSPNTLPLAFVAPSAFGGRLRAVADDLSRALSQGRSIVVISHQAQRLAEVLQEEGVPGRLTDEPVLDQPGVALVGGSLNQGWRLDAGNGLVVFTDSELFGFRKQRRRIAHEKGFTREAFLADISAGDLVVHIDHGVGRFVGLVHRSVEGVEREYLDLRFAAGDRLFVPASQVDRVSRYVGPSDRPPSLNRLGSQEWARAKERVRRAVADIARELLDLYASRELLHGRQFSEDTPWQQELEGSFPYVETPDQVQAMRAIKSDMESPQPMDRLVCGDVGYGKTELAVRAAFKAVTGGTQVAVLVPTTVLAQQHYTTFSERVSGFPLKVEMLSRFRSPSEQRAIIEKLGDGAIDIVIGTHRLLQKDVKFKELGLVVIDEEQRFGVSHKERLKQMRKEVDVLTLTATPIPRTMHMALSGIRDLSIMETPPETRQPIRTYISEFDGHVIRDAILRELERGGQVFFVHNRVHDIERVASRVREIVPEASVGIAHGQQPELALERAMLDFVEGRIDVLVCTTIIESGLDIPNVNTMIIDKADKLGLAQLYQLRGRVGRGAVRAYAFLLFDGYRALSEPAQKRLQAIFEATELGAGYQIALRDLEIRGAGNLLGAEQSGHIGAVGFDLYVRLLADAVERLKAFRDGHEPEHPKTQLSGPALDLPLTAHLPVSYIPDLNLRLAIYQRMANVTGLGQVASLRDELDDRFGTPPPAAEALLFTIQLRVLAAAVGVTSIQRDGSELVLRFKPGLSARDVFSQQDSEIRAGQSQARVRLDDSWRQRLFKLLESARTCSDAILQTA